MDNTEPVEVTNSEVADDMVENTSEISDANDTSSEIGDVPEEISSEVDSEIGDISSEVGDISSEIADVSSEARDISSEIGDVSSEVGDISSEIGDISSEARDISSEIGDASSETGDISSEIGDSVPSEIVDISSEIGDPIEDISTIPMEVEVPVMPAEPIPQITNYNGLSSSVKQINMPASTESIMEAKAPVSNITPLKAQTVTPQEPKQNPNFLQPAGVWPPPIFLNTLSATEQERFYVEHRWYMQWSYYDKKASEAKQIYQRLQLVIGIGSVTVPVLVGLTPVNDQGRYILQAVTVAISLIVAAAAAIENVKKYGDAWRTYRAAAEELAREKSLYDVGSGAYRQSQKPFLLFAERCEDVIAKQNGAFLALKEEGEKDKDGDGIPDTTTSGYSEYSGTGISTTPTPPADDGSLG